MIVDDGYVLKLNKALYGIKQAPREWNEEITKYSLAPEPENEAFIELLVTAEKFNPVGCDDGATQFGCRVVALPDSGEPVKYFGPPLQEVFL